MAPRGQLRSDEYFVRGLLPDRESRAFERWQPDDERPAILSETLVWHPMGATEPLILDIPAFFRDAEPL